MHKAGEQPDTAVSEELSGRPYWLVVEPTDAVKCVRCWHRRSDIGADADHPELCGRCVSNVTGPGENREFA